MNLSRSRMAWLVMVLMVLGLAFFLRTRHPSLPPAQHPPKADVRQDRLSHPDMVIQSSALSQLPKDILAVPLLKAILTEEFVFYYEQNESRLTLEGAFRRIAYEHDMGVGDEIIAYALNTPAQVALWKNQDGKLKDFLLVLPKQGLMRFVEALSRLALDDTQLAKERDIKLPNGEYTVWRIQHSPRHTIFFVTLKDHIAVFTDPSLLDVGKDGEQQETISRFIEKLEPNTLGSLMRLPPLTGKHTIAVSGSYLSFGYQHFFPALETLRFDYDVKGWTTNLLSSAPFAPPDALWNRLPAAPALCLALPVDKSRLLGYLQLFNSSPELPELVENLRPPAALCWYGDSQLHTPLAVLPLAKTKESWFPVLADLFSQSVGTSEAGGERLPVEESAPPGGRIWHRPVSSPHAPLDAKQSPVGKEMRSKRYFSVTFAAMNNTLILTPDKNLADRALAVLNKTYPPLSDTLGSSQPLISLAADPKPMAGLLKKALSDSLPPAKEQVFRTSVEKRFFPVLDTIAEMPAFALATPNKTGSWEPLAWRNIASPSP